MTVDTHAPPGADPAPEVPELTAKEKNLFNRNGWVLAGTGSLGRTRCRHCRGTGVELGETIQLEWLPLIRQLSATGEVIATYRNARHGQGNSKWAAAVEEIRRLIAEARALNMPLQVIADAVDVSVGMIHNYRRGNYGGKGVVIDRPDPAGTK